MMPISRQKWAKNSVLAENDAHFSPKVGKKLSFGRKRRSFIAKSRQKIQFWRNSSLQVSCLNGCEKGTKKGVHVVKHL
jgi:hypothetical protein